MSAVASPASAASAPKEGMIVNDFSINVATANGTGSQTSNMTIMRALFKMGLPVNGKNLFPSNIQGLPTWFQIRISKDGYTARNAESAITVAFNPATMVRDVTDAPAGGVIIIPEKQLGVPDRDDVIFYRVPVNQLMKGVKAKGKVKDYLTNMIYVGVVAQLLGIEDSYLDHALDHHFGGRRKLVDTNMELINRSYAWTAENIEKVDPYWVEKIEGGNAGQIMITGNDAAGLGILAGGATMVAWYPITPSTGVVDAVNQYKHLRDEESLVIIQAEDELAAMGMVIGAGWAGGRGITATSGPGIALMSEFAGLAYFAEIPSVIWNVQRVGPSTGLPTRTGQGDVLFSYYLGAGDTNNVLLFPSTPRESFEMGTTAMNLAEELQTLVLVMSDLDLGMNFWMTEPFEMPTEEIRRGKVLTAEQLVERKGKWGRYLDEDGDGVAYRTLPGNDHPSAAYFARGTGHDEYAKYSERPDDWLNNMARLARKFETARKAVPGPIIDDNDKAEVGIIYYGSSWPGIEEGRDLLTAAGTQTATMRLRALPINDEVRDFVARYDRCYVVELNRDGQMHQILRTEMPEMVMKLRSVAFMDGLPLTGPFIKNAILTQEGA